VQPNFFDAGVPSTAQVLSEHRAHPQDLVVTSGYVYWVDQGTYSAAGRDGQLLRAPVGGCHDASCPEVMADALYSPGGVTLALDGSSLYFCELADPTTLAANSGRIWQLTFGSNETPALFAMNQGGPRKLAADETALYWVNGDSGEVRRQWLDQGTPGGVNIASSQPSPVEVTVDVKSMRVYWTDFGDGSDFGGTVHSSDVDGANERTLAPAQASPRGISVGPTYVYWANAGNGTVMRATATGMSVGAFASDRLAPNDVLVDGDWLYVAEGGSAPYYQNGRIVAMSLDGSVTKVLAENQRFPRSLASDAGAVYWVNVGTQMDDQYDGAVMRVGKP
jgi:sugar lactone lactonase YvrE